MYKIFARYITGFRVHAFFYINFYPSIHGNHEKIHMQKRRNFLRCSTMISLENVDRDRISYWKTIVSCVTSNFYVERFNDFTIPCGYRWTKKCPCMHGKNSATWANEIPIFPLITEVERIYALEFYTKYNISRGT